jgi:osmoprotectant transport system substrate-binding protein
MYKSKGKKTGRIIQLVVFAAGIITLGIMLFGCKSSTKDEKKIVVGAKSFVENQIVAKIIQYALDEKGFKTGYIKDLDHNILQASLLSGEIDVYPEYTNTGIIKILKQPPVFNTAEAYRFVKDEYKKQFNISWLEPSKVNNTYCLVLSRRTADRLGITTISQLQAKAVEIRAAQGWDWATVPDLLPALEERYGPFGFKDRRLFDGLLVYQVVKAGEADLLLGNTTDPQLADKGNYVVLVDDKSVWPDYALVPVIRQQALDKYPELEALINSISSSLDTDAMIRLNARVIIDHEEVEDVAKDFYNSAIKNRG